MVCGLFPSPTRWRPKRSSSSLRVASASMMYPRRGPFWSEADYLGGKVGLNDPLLPPYPRSISHNSQDNVIIQRVLEKPLSAPCGRLTKFLSRGALEGHGMPGTLKKTAPHHCVRLLAQGMTEPQVTFNHLMPVLPLAGIPLPRDCTEMMPRLWPTRAALVESDLRIIPSVSVPGRL